ncbi:hypothetical protein C8Q73DRAFT_364953 [Cubamyces lactineus]|nr:hypothetical protein C8Q73DRAFT_364953 [Cubamyces lactineus]
MMDVRKLLLALLVAHPHHMLSEIPQAAVATIRALHFKLRCKYALLPISLERTHCSEPLSGLQLMCCILPQVRPNELRQPNNTAPKHSDIDEAKYSLVPIHLLNSPDSSEAAPRIVPASHSSLSRLFSLCSAATRARRPLPVSERGAVLGSIARALR